MSHLSMAPFRITSPALAARKHVARVGTVGVSLRKQKMSRVRSFSVCAAAGKIAVFGGSGGTGSEVIYQALEQGYEVVTLARCDPLFA